MADAEGVRYHMADREDRVYAEKYHTVGMAD